MGRKSLVLGMAKNCQVLLLLSQGSCPGGGGGGGTPYNGLYGEAPPEGGAFFRLQVYKRVGISRAKVYERVGKSVIQVSKRTFNFQVDNNIVFWLTPLPVILFSPNIVHNCIPRV